MNHVRFVFIIIFRRSNKHRRCAAAEFILRWKGFGDVPEQVALCPRGGR